MRQHEARACRYHAAAAAAGRQTMIPLLITLGRSTEVEQQQHPSHQPTRTASNDAPLNFLRNDRHSYVGAVCGGCQWQMQ
jgi:hypothetical protein